MSGLLERNKLHLFGIRAASSDRFTGLSDRIASVSAYEGEAVDIDDEATFLALADQWRAQTGMLSSISKKTQHPAYRAVIAMGERAIPLILKELRDRPGYWFEALHAITAQNPVSEQDRADPKKVREAWLQWGREKGWLE